MPTAAFSVIDIDWMDRARQRAVPTRLYWPRSAMPRTTPLIVFSHGMGGSRAGYSYLGRFWASQGCGSLHVQHEGSDWQLWRGNIFFVVCRLRRAALDHEAIERVSTCDLRSTACSKVNALGTST
jgi:predicted dienelactone hydrolase